MNTQRIFLFVLFLLNWSQHSVAQPSTPPDIQPPSLTLYTARKEKLIKPLIDLYEKQSGLNIHYIIDKSENLIQRLKSEGAHSPADILMTVDAGDLWFASQMQVLSPVQSEILTANIPAHMRDPQKHWYGLSARARTLVYHRDRVDPANLKSYPQLAEPQWHGRLCLRTSGKVYNKSLVAMLIHRHGVKTTSQFIEGWVDNLATEPLAKDSAVIQAIEDGACDVGIINSYYLGRHQLKHPKTKLSLFWPNDKKHQVHLNISGAGITTHAPNREEAIKFLEWLSQPQAQYLFASLNMEYPVNPNVPASDIVQSWGNFDADQNNLTNAGRFQKYATRLMEKAGYY